MKKVITSIMFCVFYISFCSAQEKKLALVIKGNHKITVSAGKIFYDKKEIYRYKYDDIIYTSKFNRLYYNGASTFLFLAINDRPSLDKMDVFNITSGKAKLQVQSILSLLKDLDSDGLVEFGGADITEGYDKPDSMYYIPTQYYQIKNGVVQKDQKLTKLKDLQLNGVYLSRPLNEDGYCCKVIKTPRKYLKN